MVADLESCGVSTVHEYREDDDDYVLKLAPATLEPSKGAEDLAIVDWLRATPTGKENWTPVTQRVSAINGAIQKIMMHSSPFN